MTAQDGNAAIDPAQMRAVLERIAEPVSEAIYGPDAEPRRDWLMEAQALARACLAGEDVVSVLALRGTTDA